MPASLSIQSVADVNRLSSGTPWLVLIDIELVDPQTGVVSLVKHFARNPEDVTFNGVIYDKAAFDISLQTTSGQMAQVSLTVNDYTQALQAYMEAYGGAVGSNVTLYIVNSDRLDQPPELVEYFQIIGASATDYVQSFALGAENALLQSFPRRRQTRDFCQARYKSPKCGYVGPIATCDLTLQGPNGCGVHENTLNFRSYPGLNSNGYRYG